VDGWRIDRLSVDNPRISVDYFIMDSDKKQEDFYNVFQKYKADTSLYREYERMYNNRAKSYLEMKKIANKRRQEKH
jgi:hypothetical protein